MNQNENYYESGQIYTVGPFVFSPYLAHYGVKGQKWGQRRYQNPDGTLTNAGRERYGYRPKNFAERVGERIGSALRRNRSPEEVYERNFNKTYAKARKVSRDPNASFRDQKKVQKRLSQLKDEDVKKITERLKVENEMLDQIKKRETTLNEVREMKANRTTWFSKYGFELTKKIIDKASENIGKRIQGESEVNARKAAAEATAKGAIARAQVEKDADFRAEEARRKHDDEAEMFRLGYESEKEKQRLEREDKKEKEKADREDKKEKEKADREAHQKELDRNSRIEIDKYKADRQLDAARLNSKVDSTRIKNKIIDAVQKAHNMTREEAKEYVKKNGTKLMMPDGFILDIEDF